ncbi:MAG: DUF5777 family beta-barrel protein [Chitinophagaceae bacterium]|jgi:hypothetical protein|nr:DUF5777 family beta-barrel protein [Chitinophagaceae bacterium]
MKYRPSTLPVPKVLFLSLGILAGSSILAQKKDTTDLMSMLEKETARKPVTNYTIATFKTTRLINAHSIEHVAGGVMDVKISHRFGTLNSGFYELFGLDNASIRIGADYGITDWLMIGLGRASYEKQYDGFMKVKLLRQSSGAKKMPVSISGFAGMYYNTLKWSEPDRENYETSRINYAFQLLIARKFSEGFSLQLSPTLVHKNLVPGADDPNDLLSVGIGARQKLTKRMSVNVEYYYQVPGYKLEGSVNPLSIGLDIETGGHVFQFIFTNSTGIAENQYITGTTGEWSNGDVHFGFNIARVFTLGKKKK